VTLIKEAAASTRCQIFYRTSILLQNKSEPKNKQANQMQNKRRIYLL
jgi:hypothetical protein